MYYGMRRSRFGMGRHFIRRRGMGPYWGFGMGRGGRGLGYEPVCVCPSCGYEMTHEPSIPCTEYDCPECGTPMMGSYCSAF